MKSNGRTIKRWSTTIFTWHFKERETLRTNSLIILINAKDDQLKASWTKFGHKDMISIMVAKYQIIPIRVETRGRLKTKIDVVGGETRWCVAQKGYFLCTKWNVIVCHFPSSCILHKNERKRKRKEDNTTKMK